MAPVRDTLFDSFSLLTAQLTLNHLTPVSETLAILFLKLFRYYARDAIVCHCTFSPLPPVRPVRSAASDVRELNIIGKLYFACGP